MDAMQPNALLTPGSAMPDQQQLYQQHLAQWQAAFGEYWKCCASQGAALPQQWQAMMASGFGGMQYYGGNYMNPYGSMMGAAGQLNNGVQPAAGMAGFGHAPAVDCMNGINAPQPPCDDVMAFSQAAICSGTAACAETANGLERVPQVSAPMATTATSSKAGASQAPHMHDSDADSPNTSDTQEDLPSTSMPMALQSPVATVQTASPTSAVAAGQLPGSSVMPDFSFGAPVAPTDTVAADVQGSVDASLLHASMACAADVADFAVTVKDEGAVAAEADGCAVTIASCDAGFEDAAVDAAADPAILAQTDVGGVTVPDLLPAAATAAAPCALPPHPVMGAASQAPLAAASTVAAGEAGKADVVSALSLARGAGSSPIVISLVQQQHQHQHQGLTMSLPLLTANQQPAAQGACTLEPAAGACSIGNTSTGGGSLGGSMGSGLSLQHAGSAGLGLGIDDGQGLQEDRDLKRLRRKQSNRESARRSRLRKQAENDTLQQRLHDCEAQRNTLLAENAALKQRTDQLMLIMAKLSQDKIALLALVRKLGGTVPLELEASPVTIPTAFTTTPEALQQHLAAVSVAAAAASQGTVATPAAAIAVQPPAAAITMAALPGQLQQQVQQQLAQQAQQLAQVAQVQQLQNLAASQRVVALAQPVGSTAQPAIATVAPATALQPSGVAIGLTGVQSVVPA